MVQRKRGNKAKSENLEKLPVGKHFFKILIGDFDSQLVIPSKYVESLEASSQHAVLKGPSNNSWHVEIQKNEFGITITKGWTLFCRDHSLGDGDFLVFRYDGDMQFSVQVFDKTACENEDAFHVSISKGMASLGSCEVEDQPMDDNPLTSENSEKSSSDSSKHKKRKRSQSSKQKRSNGPKAQYKVVSQRRSVTDKERRRAIDAANAFQSDLPYCRIVMRTYHVNYFFFVNIPATFRNKYLPFEEAELTLWDPSGVSWPVRYVSLTPKTRGLCGGWIPFLIGNNIEEGDVCVFELIKPKEMRTHIFRVVEEVVPLLKGRNIKC